MGATAGGLADATAARGGAIDVGLFHLDEAGFLNAAMGVQLDAGDTNRQQRILLEDINRRGGIAGRQLRPVYFRVNEQTTESFAALEQRACATWTEDNRVFAVLGHPLVGISDNLRGCLERRGVVLIGGVQPADVETYRTFTHYVGTGSPELHRQGRLLVDVLAEQGYFEPNGNVGLLTYDVPMFRRTAQDVIEPRLRARGVPLRTTAYISAPQSTAEFADAQAAIAAAGMRMRSQGVTHLIILDPSGGMSVTFMQAAENQRYRPRYGLTTTSGGQVTATMVPRAQLAGAVTLGWLPIMDVGDPSPPDTPTAFAPCANLMRTNGEMIESLFAQRAAAQSCDEFAVFAAGVSAAPAVTPDGFITGIEQLDRTVRGAQVLTLRYRTGHRDGVAAVRATVFDSSCGCFRYAGNVKHDG